MKTLELNSAECEILRDVVRRAPYMHDGSVATLKETVELYNRGGEANPKLDPKVKKLGLTPADVDAVVAAARERRADLVVVGPEGPLAAGLTPLGRKELESRLREALAADPSIRAMVADLERAR